MDKLLVLDGNSVLHRAYYALPDWRNRSGEATAGVYGFLAMLMKALEELEPTHLTIVFDNPAPTFRHSMYVGYQSNREKDRQVSEDIWGQVEKLKTVFEGLMVPVFCVAGFEADDLAGTISRQAEEAGMEVVIITGDKDYMQLVSEKVKLYMPIKGVTDVELVDRDRVKQRLGVRPEQVVDYKALVGDTSDNYPGVPGIGPKTAVKMLQEFGSFDQVVKKSGNDKVVAGYESGRLSFNLATIRRDAPVIFEPTKAILPKRENFVETFADMGYKTLTKRVEKKLQESLF
jgi:DNA polymerase-1